MALRVNAALVPTPPPVVDDIPAWAKPAPGRLLPQATMDEVAALRRDMRDELTVALWVGGLNRPKLALPYQRETDNFDRALAWVRSNARG